MLSFKKNVLRFKFSMALSLLIFVPLTSYSEESSTKELESIKKQFGAVLKLDGAAADEINAIANLLVPGSGMMAIDLHRSGEFCMREPKTGRYMIHFSKAPEKTTEDIVYFLNPDTFKQKGLKVEDLPLLPTKQGEMKPFQWYYYNGTAHDPHHGGSLGIDFLVMALDLK